MYAISRMKTRHAEVRRAPLAADGRKWKTRHSSEMMNNAITKVFKTKHAPPTARDLMKTLANEKTIPKLFRTTQHGVLSNVTA